MNMRFREANQPRCPWNLNGQQEWNHSAKEAKKPKPKNQGEKLAAHPGCENLTSRVKPRFRLLGSCEILVCVHLPDRSKVSKKKL